MSLFCTLQKITMHKCEIQLFFVLLWYTAGLLKTRIKEGVKKVVKEGIKEGVQEGGKEGIKEGVKEGIWRSMILTVLPQAGSVGQSSVEEASLVRRYLANPPIYTTIQTYYLYNYPIPVSM